MGKGGARGTSGPPPDPNALRRDRDGDGWVTLPAEGRGGEPPVWPLSRATRREGELWAAEWLRPQAVMWERNGQELEVAMYVRSVVSAESRLAPVNARTLVRQQQEALGLSLPGLARNRWRIGRAGEVQVSSGGEVRSSPRFRVVPGGKGVSAA